MLCAFSGNAGERRLHVRQLVEYESAYEGLFFKPAPYDQG